MHSLKLRLLEMKERTVTSEVSQCLKRVVVLMCRVSGEVRLRFLLLPMHSNDHILTVCIALPCSTGFFGDAEERGMYGSDT